MDFEADRKFTSLDEAAKFLFDEYLQELPALLWSAQPSGLLTRRWGPKYLFRGECGSYPATVAG